MKGNAYGAFPTWEIGIALFLVGVTLGIMFLVNEVVQYVY